MRKMTQFKKKEWLYWIFTVTGIILLVTMSSNSFSQEKPGPTNTGPSGTLTAMSGGYITTDGTLIENKQITGQVVIKANNVTIRNCIIDANSAYYAVRCDYGATNLVIEDCEIINMKSAGIYGENFTARRCDIHDSDGDAMKPKTNCLVEYCWIHHLGKGVGAHADGVQVRNAGSNMIFRYNNFDMPSDVEEPYKSNSAFILQQVEGPIHCVIEYNWINGGSYTMNLGGAEAYVRYNQFGRDYLYGIFYPGGNLYNECNTWEDTGEPVDACGSMIPETSVSVSPSSLVLTEGQTSTLTETVLPTDASNKTVTWSSDNTAIATVDASGLVSAISEGTATITATTNNLGLTSNCAVTVLPQSNDYNLALGMPVSVTLEQTPDNIGSKIVDNNTDDDSRWSANGFPQSATIDLGEECNISRLEVYTYQDRAYQYTIEASSDGSSFTQIVDRSSNTSNSQPIADNITATGRYVKIIVTGASIYTGTWVSITELKVIGNKDIAPILPTAITVSPASLDLEAGQTSQLTETVSPSDATDKSVEWSSSNTSVATVDANGLVTAAGSGTATITVETVNGLDALCNVTVTIPPSSISVSPDIIALNVGENTSLTETVLPSDATDKSVTWVSSNTSVATVDANGVVSALSSGQAIITVTTNVGGLSATCELSVTAIPSGYLIDEDFASSASNFTVIAGGTWAVSGGRYVLSNPGNANVGLLGNISVHNTEVVGDFELSTLVNITSTTSSWNDAAVVINYQDANNYYYVSLNESNDANTKGILKVENGVTTELADITAQINDATDYTLEISKTGADIVVKLDGNQVAAATDATFTNGKIGYGTKNDGAQYDNLLVLSTSAVWDAITYDDFEAGFGNFKDGGGDCTLYTGGTYAHQGSNAGLIQDNQGTYSSFYYLNSVDLSSYSQLKIDFWFYGLGMDDGHDFFVEYSDDGGTTWQIISTYVQGSGNDFVNGQFYSVADGGDFNAIVIDNSTYNFTSSVKIRFRCNGLQNDDQIYIDEVNVTATTSAAKNAVKGIAQSMSQALAVSAFPNPCQGELNVRVSGAGSDACQMIQLFDISGKKVFAKQMDGVSYLSIPTGSFDKGIYILSVSVQGSAIRQKVIITK